MCTGTEILLSLSMQNSKITIFDVAKKAGVSKGTVDRVLHNRGEVSAKSAAKVRKAIEDLNYRPNLYASLLASHKGHVIACLIPDSGAGEYWSLIHEGFEDGKEYARTLGAEVRIIRYNQYDVQSFRHACDQILEAGVSAVVLPPLFFDETMVFTDSLSKAGIPYIYVDTKMDDECCFAYYGMPTFSSGVLCGALLTERCDKDEVDQIAIIRLSRKSDPTADRRAGFIKYINSNFPKAVIHSVFINPEEPGHITEELNTFFDKHKGIRYMVMFNSRIHLISEWLRNNPCEKRRVIGFDNLEGNLELLREGSVDIIIAQHAAEQSKMAVTALVDYLLLHKKPACRDNYMHMDILTKYNIDNY